MYHGGRKATRCYLMKSNWCGRAGFQETRGQKFAETAKWSASGGEQKTAWTGSSLTGTPHDCTLKRAVVKGQELARWPTDVRSTSLPGIGLATYEPNEKQAGRN